MANNTIQMANNTIQMATLESSNTGLAALQEISIKVSFISAQNPLLPDGYSNLPTYNVFTEERPSLLAKNCMNRGRHWCYYFFRCSCFMQASNLRLGSLSGSPYVTLPLRKFHLNFILSTVG